MYYSVGCRSRECSLGVVKEQVRWVEVTYKVNFYTCPRTCMDQVIKKVIKVLDPGLKVP